MSETARVRFLETRVVDDAFKGTARESRFEAGGVYELPIRSADRWVKRGAAAFDSIEDESKAIGASSNVTLAMLDSEREQVAADGTVRPATPPVRPTAVSTAPGDERAAIVERIAVGVVAARLGMTREVFTELPLETQMEHLLEADVEVAAHFAGPTKDEDLNQRTAGPVTNAGSDTDGDQLGDVATDRGTAMTSGDSQGIDPARSIAGTTEHTTNGIGPGVQEPGSGLPPVAVDFDAMTDVEIRDYIDKRDGRRPRRDASRETLLATARKGAAA